MITYQRKALFAAAIIAVGAIAGAKAAIADTTISPATQTALQGSSPYFFVAAEKGATYQWMKDGKEIAGATAATLRLHEVKAADAGNYTLAKITAAGKSTTAPAALKVAAPAADPAPKLPAIPDKVYDVTATGAVGDGVTDNAAAIQKSIDAAFDAGGGIVEIPPASKPYVTGPLLLGTKINLQIDAGATLQALPYAAAGNTPAYPVRTGRYEDFITTDTNTHDVAITGGGTIDGQGAAWWAAFRTNRNMAHRPFLLRFNGATNALISGVTVTNSPMFHLAMSNCNNLTIFGVTIRSPFMAPNTDGIDPSGSHQLIQNCDIACGDDNIAVKAGGAFCTDITIADCLFGAGHGVSVGGQSNRGLDGMVVKNCTFTGTTSGLRLKADPTQGGVAQNITYSDLTMTNVQYPIVFYSYYKTVGGPGAVSGRTQTTVDKVKTWNAQPPNSLATNTMPVWKNITVNNLTATGVTGYDCIFGLPREGYFIDNVTFNNVQITGGPGFEIYDATNIRFTGKTSVGNVLTCNSLAITGQPEDQSAAVGAKASFTVTAVGESGIKQTPPTYQWNCDGKPLVNGKQADGSEVAGATEATLMIANLQVAEAGKYTATVTGTLDAWDLDAGAIASDKSTTHSTSNPATLTIAPK